MGEMYRFLYEKNVIIFNFDYTIFDFRLHTERIFLEKKKVYKKIKEFLTKTSCLKGLNPIYVLNNYIWTITRDGKQNRGEEKSL